MTYTDSFKKTMVQKLLTPGGKGVKELSEEIGVCTQTLYNWRDRYSNVQNAISTPKSPRKWTIKEKYSAVLASSNLPEKEYGRWLRETGLLSEHIEIWKKEVEETMSSPKDKEEIKVLKKKNKELENELRRKEKALAEMAALITLQKKTAFILADEDN